MLFFARLIRGAIVASGTMNARAISPVVRPPTARSVSATCDAGVTAGWQHRNSSVNVSSASGAASTSAPGATSSSGPAIAATLSSRRRRALSLRNWSVSRRVATVINHPRGFAGTPPTGHCVAAASNASCTASSHRSNCPYRRTRKPSTCGASSRSTSSTCATSVPLPSIRPARPSIGPDRDHRSARWIGLVLRVFGHQQLNSRQLLVQHPRDAIHPDPPQMRPVLVVLIHHYGDPLVGGDVPQPPQGGRRLRLLVDRDEQFVAVHDVRHRYDVRPQVGADSRQPPHPGSRHPSPAGRFVQSHTPTLTIHVPRPAPTRAHKS